MKKALLFIVIIIVALLGYTAYAGFNTDYDYEIAGYKPVKVDWGKMEAVLNIVINLTVKSGFMFNIPVDYLYYEVYYKGNTIGKSADTSGFTLKKKPESTPITQSIDIHLNETNMQVVRNYITKQPTDFELRVHIGIFGFIKIGLKKIKFTYQP